MIRAASTKPLHTFAVQQPRYFADQDTDAVYELYRALSGGGVSPVKLNAALPVILMDRHHRLLILRFTHEARTARCPPCSRTLNRWAESRIDALHSRVSVRCGLLLQCGCLFSLNPARGLDPSPCAKLEAKTVKLVIFRKRYAAIQDPVHCRTNVRLVQNTHLPRPCVDHATTLPVVKV